MSDGSPGSGRAMRLDPHALPLRFFARDAGADGGLRDVELTAERVVMRRCLGGMRMALNMPVAAFSGVALTVCPEGVSIVLAHKDPGLALSLAAPGAADDALLQWHDWARALALPLLVDDENGLRHAFPRLGALTIGRVRPRRRRRSRLQGRRPAILLRRGVGRPVEAMPVHRGEREIVARD